MLTIDTGAEPKPVTAVDLVPGWLSDHICPDSYSPAQIVQTYAHHMIGDMNRPRKLETVRAHILNDWNFLRLLAAENPGLFDEILCAYVERFLGGE